MLELFAMPFFSRSLIALLITGVSFPLLGIFIVHLELIPARFAVMHAALLGGAIALLFGVSTTWVALLASILTGLGIAIFSWKSRMTSGGMLGLIMTVCLGLSFIIFYKSNVQATQAFTLFWGNILALTKSDTIFAVVTGALILLFVITCYKEIHTVLFDREIAWAVGVHAKFVYTGIIIAVCLGIAAAMRITGALLVDAVTILPALAARQIGVSFKALIVWGAVFGVGMNMTGFALSFVLDLPVSPAIIVIGAVVVLIMGVIHGKQV
ncbi:zinc ABC transporter permease [Spirochaetia bacterium]|nr:zinc ABC transporter permease [Spirochaetia bacterium]